MNITTTARGGMKEQWPAEREGGEGGSQSLEPGLTTSFPAEGRQQQ